MKSFPYQKCNKIIFLLVSISVTDDKNHTNNILDSNGKRDDDSDKYEMVPPDGGWGWFVLFGSMLINILVPGTIKSFGVLFVEFQEAFQSSPAESAWIPALCKIGFKVKSPRSYLIYKLHFQVISCTVR